MAIVELLNTTNMLIVLADSTGNFGSVQPNSVYAIDESALAKECVASPIRKGWLKIKQGGKFVGPKGAPKNKKADASGERPSDKPVSFFPEEPEQGAIPNVVTHDFEKSAKDAEAKAAAVADGATENLGQKIVRRGRKKKLVPVNVQKGGPRRTGEIPERVRGQLPNVPQRPRVIEINGQEFAGIAGVTRDAQIIIPSSIPGAAQLVGVEDAQWDQLTRMANETNKLVDDLARDRKMFMYSNQSDAQRATFIERTSDVGFLRGLEGGELNPKLLKVIRAKIKSLEGTNVQQKS